MGIFHVSQLSFYGGGVISTNNGYLDKIREKCQNYLSGGEGEPGLAIRGGTFFAASLSNTQIICQISKI